MKVGLQQRVVAAFRVEFLRQLASNLDGDLSVYGGQPRRSETLATARELEVADFVSGTNINVFGGAFYVCLQPGLLKWLRQQDPDVLIVEGNPRLLMNWLAAAWMRRRKRPVLAWGMWAPRERRGANTLTRAIWRSYAGLFSGHIAYGTRHKDECVQLGVPASQVFVAPNSVSPSPPDWPVRKPVGNGITVLFVGRLEGRKRVDLLIRACSGIRPRAELWVVGDGPERDRLEELAVKEPSATRFFDSQFGSALTDLFLRADLFAMPGTGGLAVQEAMYHGLPVAVAEADGTQADLVGPKNGWILPPGDLNALTRVLQSAADEPSALRDMGLESLEIVRTRANLDLMVKGFLTALAETECRNP